MEPAPVSSNSFDLASVLPFRVAHNEHRSLPDGIHAIYAHLIHRDWSCQFRIFDAHSIGLPLREPLNVRGRVRYTFDVSSRPGDVFLIPHGEPANYEYHHRSPGTPTVVMLFLEPWVLRAVALQSLERDPDRVELMVRNGEPDPFIHALGQAFVSELQSGGIAGSLYLESLTQTLAIHLLREHSTLAHRSAASVHTAAHARMRRVVEFIDAHLHQPLTLADIAAEVQLSPYHLTRSFKQSMGVSLHQYIIAQRVERGRRLLESGSHTIGEVAGLVGFADHSHFTQHFKRGYGVPPSAVVKMRKNIHM